MRDRVMRYVPGVLMMRAGARDDADWECQPIGAVEPVHDGGRRTAEHPIRMLDGERSYDMANLFMWIKRFPIRGLCVQAAEDSQHGAGLHSPAYCLYVRVGGGNGAASLLPCNGEKSVQRMMRPHMPSVGVWARDICEFAMSLFRREIRMMAEHTVVCKASIRLRIGGDGPHSRVMCRALSSCIVFPASCVVPPCVPSGITSPFSGPHLLPLWPHLPHQAPHHSPRSHPTLLWYTGTLRGEIAVIRNSPCQMVVLGPENGDFTRGIAGIGYFNP